MQFFASSLDLLLIFSIATGIYILWGFIPLKTKWQKTNFLYLGLLVSYFMLSAFSLEAVQRQVTKIQKEKLLGYAPAYSLALSFLGHSKLNLNTSPTNPFYLKMIEYQKSWTKENPFIADIYTMKMTRSKEIALILDSETDYNKDGIYSGERESRTKIGEPFEKNLPELNDAFMGKATFTTQPYSDRWGSWVSSFVPILDEKNKVEAVLGLDFPSEVYLQDIRQARQLTLACITLLFMLVTTLFAKEEQHRIYDTALKAALHEAKQATEVKARFLANMSHEIRTPLNAILGTITLMNQLPVSDEMKEKITTVKTCSDSLLSLVNDILDFSKMESGKLIIELVPFSIASALSEIVDFMRPIAQQKNLSIELDSNVDSNLFILSDLNRLRQVLLNLISNAVKFTSEGGVFVSLRVLNMSAERCEIGIEVRDTGIGIQANAQKKLFQSFSQVDASTTRRFGGTGLGLAISKGIIEALGGKISVKSSFGEGSTFTITLTSKVVAKPTQMKKDLQHDRRMAEKHPLKILVADDQHPNRMLALSFLAMLGYKADSVCNGREAVNAFEYGHYDVVFMDCQMPEMDGFAATTILKNQNLATKRPWIVALTASAFPEDKNKCLQAGMDDFVSKPFALHDLASALERSKPLNRHNQSESTSIDFDEPSSSSASIFDKRKVVRHFANDQDVMKTFIDQFFKTLWPNLEKIDAAIKDQKGNELKLLAHSLRGNVSNFYANTIVADLLELEKVAETKDFRLSQSLYFELRRKLHLLVDELEKLRTERVA